MSSTHRKRPLVTYSKRRRNAAVYANLGGTSATSSSQPSPSDHGDQTGVYDFSLDHGEESNSKLPSRPKRKLERMLFGDSKPKSKPPFKHSSSPAENALVDTTATRNSVEKTSTISANDHLNGMNDNDKSIEPPSTPTKTRQEDGNDNDNPFCVTPRDSPLALTPQKSPSPSPRRRKLKDQLIARVEYESNTDKSPSKPKSLLSPARSSQNSPKSPEVLSPSSVTRKSGPSSSIRSVVTYSRTRSFLASSFSDNVNTPLIPIPGTSSNPSESEDEETDTLDGKPAAAKVLGFYELRRSGQNSRIVDELEYILESLNSSHASSQRAGYLAIATKMCDYDFVQRFRSSGFPGRIFLQSPAHDDVISKFAFLFTAYVFTKDGPSSAATSLVVDYEIFNTLSFIDKRDSRPISEVYNDPKVKLSKICREEVGDLMSKIKNSEDVKLCGSRNQMSPSVIRVSIALLLVLTEKCDKDLCMNFFLSFFKSPTSDWIFSTTSNIISTFEQIVSEQDTRNVLGKSSQAGIEYFMILTLFECVLEAAVSVAGNQDVSWIKRDGVLKNVGRSLRLWLKLHQRYLYQGLIDDDLEIVDYSNVALRVLILATTVDTTACGDLSDGEFVKTLVGIILDKTTVDDESSQSRGLYALGLIINMAEAETTRKVILANMEPILDSFREWCTSYVARDHLTQRKYSYLDDRAEYMAFAVGSVLTQEVPLEARAWSHNDISLALRCVRDFSKRLQSKDDGNQLQQGPIIGQSGLTVQLAKLEQKLSGLDLQMKAETQGHV